MLEESLQLVLLLRSESSLHYVLLDELILLLDFVHEEPELAVQGLAGTPFRIKLVTQVLHFHLLVDMNVLSLGQPLQLFNLRVGLQLIELAAHSGRLLTHLVQLVCLLADGVF